MDAQLETLLQIQDLKAQKKELAEAETREMQQEQFNLDVDAALQEIDSKISELEDELEPSIQRRYQRLARGMNRVVVPAIKGVCYGCFVSVATAVASDREERGRAINCAHCGRFLYFMD